MSVLSELHSFGLGEPSLFDAVKRGDLGGLMRGFVTT